VLAPEPLWQRLTLVFLGLPSAFAAYSMGLLIGWILMGASAMYDPVNSALWLTFRLLTSAAFIAGRFLAWLATDFLPACLKAIIAFCEPVVARWSGQQGYPLPSCVATVGAVVWTFGKVKRTGTQAAAVLARLIRRCVMSDSHLRADRVSHLASRMCCHGRRSGNVQACRGRANTSYCVRFGLDIPDAAPRDRRLHRACFGL